MKELKLIGVIVYYVIGLGSFLPPESILVQPFSWFTIYHFFNSLSCLWIAFYLLSPSRNNKE